MAKTIKNSGFLEPIDWVVKVYGTDKLAYIPELFTPDDWWTLMEDYGKYVSRKIRKKTKQPPTTP